MAKISGGGSTTYTVVCRFCGHGLIQEKVPGWISARTMSPYCPKSTAPLKVHVAVAGEAR